MIAMLTRNGIKIAGQETGGCENRTVRLDLANGNFSLEALTTSRLL